MTRLDRRALFATGSAAALFAAVGVSAAESPARGGHLRVALSGGDRGETWFDMPGGHFLQAARHAVFETLTDVAADGTLHPSLAESWTAFDEGRVWRLSLRKDVLFHDGTPFTADSVTASLDNRSLIKTASALGIDEVELTLTQPDAAFPFRLADGVYSIFSHIELAKGGVPTQGTGPYKIKRFEPGRSFLGERVAHHRMDKTAGWFDTVELISISDDVVRAEAVRDGYVDAADLDHAHDLAGRDDLDLLMDAGSVQAAVRKSISYKSRLGAHPLDALRFSTRWWMSA